MDTASGRVGSHSGNILVRLVVSFHSSYFRSGWLLETLLVFLRFFQINRIRLAALGYP